MPTEEKNAVSVTSAQIEDATKFVLVTPPQAVAVRLAQYVEQVRVYRHILEAGVQERLKRTDGVDVEIRSNCGSAITEALSCLQEETNVARAEAIRILSHFLRRYFPDLITED